jgi:molybdopterin-guanine dinucleotide biosynthesis protein A
MTGPAAAAPPRTAAAIIAGGRGTRMGAGGGAGAKGLLVVDGRRIVDRQLEALRPRFDDVIIVANDPQPWRGLAARIVADRVGAGAAGPLAGLDAALAALPADAAAVVCVAGDMPFPSGAVLELLRDLAPDAPAVVARIGGRPEPLLARYGRACAPIVAEQLARGERALMRLLDRLDVTWIDEDALRAVDPRLRCVVNVNTPAELAALEDGGDDSGGPARRP